MQVASVNNNNNNSFNGLLTIKKETNAIQNVYKMGLFKNKKLNSLTLNTDLIESVSLQPNKKSKPKLQDNIIISMLNGIKYKITSVDKDVFVKYFKAAQTRNTEEVFRM